MTPYRNNNNFLDSLSDEFPKSVTTKRSIFAQCPIHVV